MATTTGSWIEVWEPYTGKLRRRLADVTDSLSTLTITPDGKRIASGYSNGAVRIWDVASGEQAASLEGHRGYITSLAFSPDNELLGSGSVNTTILLWKMPAPAKAAEPALEKCWDDMREADAKSAYSAMLNLAGNPAKALPFLERKLRALNLDRVPQLLADLDSDDFNIREQTSQKLAGMGNKVRQAVTEALKATASPEIKHRCEALLEKMGKDKMQPEQLRTERVLETFQMIGTPEARKLLKRFSGM